MKTTPQPTDSINPWRLLLQPINLQEGLKLNERATKIKSGTSMTYQRDVALGPEYPTVRKNDTKPEIIRLFDAGKNMDEIASTLKTTIKHVRKTLIATGKIEKKHCVVANMNSRPVIQLSPEGEILAEFKSVSEAARELGISNEGVRKTCHGARKSAGGFGFKFRQ